MSHAAGFLTQTGIKLKKRQYNIPPTLCIVGQSNSGKTSLIEQILPILKQEGLTVAVIKRDGHDKAVFDHDGKDTWRFAKAGADSIVLATPTRIFKVEKLPEELHLDELVWGYKHMGLVLTEGFKHSAFPKIEVVRHGNEPLCSKDVVDGYIHVKYDTQGCPVFTQQCLLELVDWIKENIL